MNTELFTALYALPEEFPGIDHLSDDVLYLMGVRKFNQFCITLRSLIDHGRFCSFCNPTLSKNQPFIEIGAWRAKDNDWPYAAHTQHIVLFPWQHYTHVAQLPPSTWEDLGKCVGEICRQRKIIGGGFVMRFGSPRNNAGTMQHLHAHLQVPDGTEEARATLSKPFEDRVKNYKRLKEHIAELNVRGGFGWLFSPEGIETTKQ